MILACWSCQDLDRILGKILTPHVIGGGDSIEGGEGNFVRGEGLGRGHVIGEGTV